MMDSRDMPTAADYLRSEGTPDNLTERVKRLEEGLGLTDPEPWETKLTLEEQVVMLQGQVSFLAGFVEDMLDGYEWHSASDRDMLEKIREKAKG